MSPDSLSLVFSALADPTRRAILVRLSEGERSVNELAAPFEISLPGVSKHLKVLEKAGLIERTRATDRRRIGLSATDAGAGILASVKRRRTAWLADHLKELTEDEREAISAALPALEKLLEAPSR